MRTLENNEGFTLIETIIGMGVFAIVASGIYIAYANVLDIINAGNHNATALGIIDAELEVIRNMQYDDIGVQDGFPLGKLLASKTVTVDNVLYTVNTTVRNTDDPFDGTVGGNPNDLAPADYRLVEVEVTCTGCQKFLPTRITTTAAPKSLESASNKGSLFINVLNASGGAVSGANISVVNNAVTPPININAATGVNGQLQLVDIATSSGGYQITITKNGYSADRTYAPGTPPNPVKPHATVVSQQLTIISFAIDQVSTLNFKTQDAFCRGIAGIDFQQTGVKLIGTDPSTPKYSAQHITDAAGSKQLVDLEWDTYSFTNLDSEFDLAGSNPLGALAVDPNQTYSVTWNVASKIPLAFLATVKDSAGQTVPGASVRLNKTGFDQTKITGQDTFTETSWSSGNFDSKSSNITVESTADEVGLVDLGGGTYASDSQEWLISKTLDMGTGTTTFHTFSWNPLAQPSQTGANGLKFQIAANNDDATWNFTGPDGTAGTYYTVASGSSPHTSLNGNRYLRYKAHLQTDDEQYTPQLEDISLVFSSPCSPDYQTLFTGLTSGTYTITVAKTGYQTFTNTNVLITGNWQEYQVTLTP